MKHRVRNCPEYEDGLRNRGSPTFWGTPQAMRLWPAQARSTPGGLSRYSDQAIQNGLMMRLVFGQALRQTEGLMGSIFQLLGVDLRAPDHTTVSRRSMTLEAFPRECVLPAGPLHLLIDSTGLKLFGVGEWLQEKPGQKSRRSCRKLYLAVDARTGISLRRSRYRRLISGGPTA